MHKMIKISLISSFVFSGVIFGADFSKKTNDELIKLSGIVDPKDILDYRKEIENRIDNMTKKEAKEFRDRIREQEDRVYDDMKVKDLKLRKQEIRDAIEKQCKNNSELCNKMGPRLDKPDGKNNHKGAKHHHDMEHKPGKLNDMDSHIRPKPSPKP